MRSPSRYGIPAQSGARPGRSPSTSGVPAEYRVPAESNPQPPLRVRPGPSRRRKAGLRQSASKHSAVTEIVPGRGQTAGPRADSSVRGILRDDIDAASDHRTDQTLIPEHLDGLLYGPSRYSVLLRQTVDRWQRTARRNVASLDLASQDLGKLQVDRYVSLVINRHTGDCR